MARARQLSPPLPAPAAAETGGTLTIDLAAIEANWRALAHQLLTVECAAVVKANAYGLGLQEVTSTLARAGCKTFFVADLAEARSVRSRVRDATIYVLDGYTPDWGDGFIEINARPVINSTTELAEWDAFVSAHAWQGGAALHVDTGMRRLGISPEEAAALAPRAQTENHGIALLLSHLACADIAGSPAQCRANSIVSRVAYAVSGHSRLAREFVRHLSERLPRISILRGRARRFMGSIPRPVSLIR